MCVPHYVVLTLLRADHVQGVSEDALGPLLAVYAVMNVFMVWLTLTAIRRFVSRTRVWIHFGMAIHYLVFSSAAAYWSLGAVDTDSFAEPRADGISPVQALYLSFTTFSTTGYGDVQAVSLLARTVVLFEGFLSFVLVLALAFVLLRATTALLAEGGPTKAIRSQVAQERGYSSLRPWDRLVTLGATSTCAVMWAAGELPENGALDIWQWGLVSLCVGYPMLFTVRAMVAAYDPFSAPDRVKYLFSSAISTLVFGYAYVYWLTSHAREMFVGASGSDGLRRVEALGLAVGNTVTRAFGGVMPLSDTARLLVILQQSLTFVLFAVVFVYVNVHWRPAEDLVDSRVATDRARRELAI